MKELANRFLIFGSFTGLIAFVNLMACAGGGWTVIKDSLLSDYYRLYLSERSSRGEKVIYALYTFLDNCLDRFYCTLCLYFNGNRIDTLYIYVCSHRN